MVHLKILNVLLTDLQLVGETQLTLATIMQKFMDRTTHVTLIKTRHPMSVLK
jgi:hypothetical protein